MRPLAIAVLLVCGRALGDETAPLSPKWAPLVVPVSVFAPGVGQLIRGERRAGGTLLAVSGIALGLTAGAGVFLGASGASDVSAAIGVPIVVLGASTLLTLAAADILGAFAEGPAPPLADAWSARWRVAAGVLAPMHSDVPAAPAAFVSHRGERWLLQGTVTTSAFEAGGGALLWRYSDVPRAGLWVEAGARYGWDSARSLRGRVQLVSVLPMALFGERFSRMTSVLRLGVDPTWLWYPGRSKADVEVSVSGGFEVRLVLSQTLRFVGGYEHSRDGPLGGLAAGFVGRFFGGLELALLSELFLVGRAEAGTPSGFTLALEWRR